MEENEALHAATAALARLDERLKTDPLREVLHAWSLTNEAIGISQVEGLGVREDDLVSSLMGAGEAILDKSVRTARDIRAALEASSGAPTEPLDTETITSAFRAMDSSNVYRDADSIHAAVEAAAAALAESISAHTTPSPWTAAATLSQIVRSHGFFGKSVRLGLTLSPRVTRAGFGLARAVPLLSHDLIAACGDSLPALMEIAGEDDKWRALYFTALANGGKRANHALATLGRLANEASGSPGTRRASSRFDHAVRAFLARPILTVNDLASHLDVTYPGAKLLIQQMCSAGLVSQRESGSQSFAFPKALNVAPPRP